MYYVKFHIFRAIKLFQNSLYLPGILRLGFFLVRKRPNRKKVSYNLKNFWAAREITLGRMFYPLSAQGKCFNLAIARIKHPFPFPTIGKNKFLPLVFLWLPKIFQDIGTVILSFYSLFRAVLAQY